MLINVNLNTLVTFTLTQEGLKKTPWAVRQLWKITDKNLTATTELWDFMAVFGANLYMGQIALVENNTFQIHYVEK